MADQRDDNVESDNSPVGTLSSDAPVRSGSGADDQGSSSPGGGKRGWKTWEWERTAASLRHSRRPEALASLALFDAIDECAPEEFIRNLIRTYPGTLRDGYMSGDLPLHVILRRSASGGTGGSWSSSLINFIIRENPSALDVPSRGEMPVSIWMRAWEDRFDQGTARKFTEVLKTMIDINPRSALQKDLVRRRGPSRQLNLSLLEVVEWDWLGDSDEEEEDEEEENVRSTHWDVLMMLLRATWRAEEILRGRDIGIGADFLPIHSYIRLENRSCPIQSLIPSCPTPAAEKIRSDIQYAIRRDDYRSYIDSFRKYKTSLGIFYSIVSTRLAYKIGRHHVLAEIIERYQQQVRTADAEGKFPLHLAAQHIQITSNIIDELVKVDPLAASTPDREGRLPLHLAVEAGRSWEEGLDVMLAASPRAVETPDSTTFLYPFMAAAVGNVGSLDTVYRLLRRSPDLVLGLSCVWSTSRPSKRRRLG